MFRNHFLWTVSLTLLLATGSQLTLAQRKSAATTASRTVLHTRPNATVWLDDVRRGFTDANGALELSGSGNRVHVLRIRAAGYREITRSLAPPWPRQLLVQITLTADEAELAFQQAELLREQKRDSESRKQAVELYRRALGLRPKFAAAHLGLARLLSDLADNVRAADEIDEARRVRPIYPEASAVEGRILRADQDDAGAIEAFKRALREAHGYQPEAHTGLALIYEDQGDYDAAIREFRAALEQLYDTEPLLYQLLGALLEKQEKYNEAIAAYEKYVQLDPNGKLTPAVRSMIEQLRKQGENGGFGPK